MNVINYKPLMDKFSKISTISITILFVGIPVFEFHGSKEPNISSYLILLLLVLIYLGAFAFHPIRYILSKDKLVIKRLAKNLIINNKEISEVQSLSSEDLNWSTRTFGIEGFFGYFGKFSNDKHGDMVWYVTNRRSPVCIETIHGKKIIISPPDPAQFVADFNQIKIGAE